MVPVESVDVFRGRPYNPFPYEFAFELLVKGPCLLAGRGGVESIVKMWVMFPGPSLLGECEGLFLGILLHFLQVKKPSSNSIPGAGTPQSHSACAFGQL